MDYSRIYDDLIADRRTNTPREDEYYEVHHILPRCMGGSDEAENLIRLRPEDHFFAHLLLAKVHGGSMWAAVRIMAAAAVGVKPEVRSHRFGKSMPGIRARYAAGRRWANEHLVGLGHPSADKTVYHWRHLDGRECRLAQVEFASAFSLQQSNVSSVVRGISKSTKGWFLADRHSESDLERPSGLRHGCADKTAYQFKHIDGREFFGTRIELAANDNVPRASIDNIVRGVCLSAYGWYIPQKVSDGVIGTAATSGDRSGTADKSVYQFKRVDGIVETCTRQALIKKYDLDAASFNHMASGKAFSSQGWFRPDLNPEGVFGTGAERNGRFNPETYRFVHDDGREETLTLHAMHLKHGGNRACWNKPLSGKTYRGWALYGSAPARRSDRGTVYQFQHSSGRIFTGRQKDLAEAFGLSQATACRAVKSGAGSAGWKVVLANDNIQYSEPLAV